jgi:hypothetical protein
MFSSPRKRGGADFFSGFVWWVVWAESKHYNINLVLAWRLLYQAKKNIIIG